MNSLFGVSEELIEAFEDARTAGRPAKVSDFLPATEHPYWLATLQELIRIDMELDQRQGGVATIEKYRAEWPLLFESPELLTPLAFEDYRLASQRGVAAAPQSYADRYGVDVSTWPVLRSTSGQSQSSTREVTEGRSIRIEPGTQLLDFEIVAPLGEGAFSKVLLARQLSLSGRLVVLKFSSRRLREADRLARLQHTNIVPLYSVHDWNDLCVLCMPWFGSATLRDVIEPARGADSRPSGEMLLSTVKGCDSRLRTQVNGQPAVTADPVQESDSDSDSNSESAPRRGSPLQGLDGELAAVWIAQQIAEGLKHAHERGVLHRDLKPANVLLTSDGVPMILDFNLSALQPDEVTAGGTLPYMSPEQLESLETQERVDERSDIFSLGVVLFELLTGERPFPDLNLDRRQMIQDRRTIDVSPRSRNRLISVDTDSIVRRCLSSDVTRRYQKTEELIEDLGRQLTSRPLRYAENRSIRERLQKWARRHPRITSGTSVLIFCSALLLIGVAQYLRISSRLVESESQRAATQFLQVVPDLQAEGFSAAIGDSDRNIVASRIREVVDKVRPMVNQSPASSTEITKARQALDEMGSMLELLGSEATATAPAHPQTAPYLIALQHAMSRQFTEAADTLRPVVQGHPELFESTLLLGMLARAQKTGDSADALLTAALALRPDDFTTLMQRGISHLTSSRYEAAIRDFESALRVRKEAPDAWFSLGLAQKGAGKLKDALSSYDKAIEYKFPETRIHFAKADLLELMGNKDEARLAKESGLKLTPKDDRSWVARGLAQLPNSPELAVQDIRRAFELNPSSHDAFRNLSMVLSEYLKKPDEAIVVLDAAILVHPQDEYLWAGRGVLHARGGDSKKAIADAQQALKLSDDPFLLYMVACIYSLSSGSEQQDSSRVEALRLIAKSLRQDASLADSMQSDPDLKNLHSDKRFQQLIAAAGTLANPIPER
ncbi:MAG: protein kinase [Planctomycetaceae bacterium]|nr:protein kinase [Planctomycetaceae bacterium]